MLTVRLLLKLCIYDTDSEISYYILMWLVLWLLFYIIYLKKGIVMVDLLSIVEAVLYNFLFGLANVIFTLFYVLSIILNPLL